MCLDHKALSSRPRQVINCVALVPNYNNATAQVASKYLLLICTAVKIKLLVLTPGRFTKQYDVRPSVYEVQLTTQTVTPCPRGHHFAPVKFSSTHWCHARHRCAFLCSGPLGQRHYRRLRDGRAERARVPGRHGRSARPMNACAQTAITRDKPDMLVHACVAGHIYELIRFDQRRQKQPCLTRLSNRIRHVLYASPLQLCLHAVCLIAC